MKQFLSTICIAAACCASASAAIPTIDQITGSYIESDSTVNQDETTGVEQVMWSTCNDFTISRVEGSDDRIAISGFWRSLNGERHTIEATYSPTTGRITMPAGTVVWVDNQYGFDDNGDIVVTGQEEINIYNYTYNTSSGAWELSERDIVFSYDEETGRWCHNGYIAVTEEGSVYEAPYNTTFIRANGTVTNESYSFNSTGDRNDYGEESRPCYVDFSTGTILNLLYTDKYGHGTQVNFEASSNKFTIYAAPIASITEIEYSYKVLVAVDIDPDTYHPSLADDMDITGDITDGDNGTKKVSFVPSAIFAASYNSSTNQILIDSDMLYEVVERLELSYTPDATSSVEEVMAGEKTRTVAAEEYYDLQGRRLTGKPATGIVIKKTTYTDGTTESVKEIARN